MFIRATGHACDTRVPKHSQGRMSAADTAGRRLRLGILVGLRQQTVGQEHQLHKDPTQVRKTKISALLVRGQENISCSRDQCEDV